GGSPEEEERPRVKTVLPDDVATPPRRQPVLRPRALAERPRMRMDRDGVGRQSAPPAAPDAPDRKGDVFQVGEERRIESTHLEECDTVEGRGASARSERIEWVAPQNLEGLAVQVVEAVEGPVDDDARRVDPSLVSETNEHRCRHDDSLPG